MCEIVMLIVMLVFGILALARGRFLLTRAKEVRGLPARIIGILLMLPLPLVLCAGLLLGVVLAAQGKTVTPSEAGGVGAILEIAIIALCVLAVVVIALVYAQPVRKRRVDNTIEEGDVPDRYREHFQAEEEGRPRQGSDRSDVTDQPPRHSSRPDDRIQD